MYLTVTRATQQGDFGFHLSAAKFTLCTRLVVARLWYQVVARQGNGLTLAQLTRACCVVTAGSFDLLQPVLVRLLGFFWHKFWLGLFFDRLGDGVGFALFDFFTVAKHFGE